MTVNNKNRFLIRLSARLQKGTRVKIKSSILTLVFFMCLLLQAQDTICTDARGNPVPEKMLKKISIDLEEVPLRKALSILSEKWQLNLNFTENIIPDDHKITVKLKNTPIVTVLLEILKETDIDFVISRGEQIVLLKLKQINSTQKFTISGFLSDAKTGEALIGTNIYIKKLLTGCTSNVYGFYSLTVPAGRFKIVYSFIGYKIKVKDIILNKNIMANIELETSPFISDTVFVTASREENFVKNTEIGTISLSPQKLSSMPVLFGEQDILKTLHLLPGVTLQREGDSGFNVRGGNSDQNLILLDEAPVYNAFHFFGFFSVFNSDAIKNVKLIKGSAPPKYGGKLSSVLDIQMNEGNFKKFHGNGGVGLIFSRLTLEGPIKKDKSSFIISGRRTYADVFTRLSSMEEVQKSTLYFYDFKTIP